MKVKMDILKTIMNLNESDLTIINSNRLDFNIQDEDKNYYTKINSDLFEFYDKLLFHPLTEENIKDYIKIKNDIKIINRVKKLRLCNLLLPYYNDNVSIKNFIDEY